MSAVKSKDICKWIEAAEKLTLNSSAVVRCPECEQPTLRVRDIEYGCAPNKGLERYVICSQCGAYNIVSLARAEACAEKANVKTAVTG